MQVTAFFPLTIAVTKDLTNIANLLISYKANVDRDDLLMMAVKRNNIKIVKSLI